MGFFLYNVYISVFMHIVCVINYQMLNPFFLNFTTFCNFLHKYFHILFYHLSVVEYGFFFYFRGSVRQVLGFGHRLWPLHVDLLVHWSCWTQSYWVCVDSEPVKNARWPIQNKTVWFSHVIWDQNIKLSNRSSRRMFITFLNMFICVSVCVTNYHWLNVNTF